MKVKYEVGFCIVVTHNLSSKIRSRVGWVEVSYIGAKFCPINERKIACL